MLSSTVATAVDLSCVHFKQFRLTKLVDYNTLKFGMNFHSTSGLVVKSNVAIVGPRVRFSAGAAIYFYMHETFFFTTQLFGLLENLS